LLKLIHLKVEKGTKKIEYCTNVLGKPGKAFFWVFITFLSILYKGTFHFNIEN